MGSKDKGHKEVKKPKTAKKKEKAPTVIPSRVIRPDAPREDQQNS